MTVTALRTTRHSARTAAVGVLTAVVAATAIWAAAALAGADLTARFGSGAAIDVTVVSVVLAALFTSLAGWGLLVALRSFTAKARTVWTIAAAIAALASLAGPLSATASAGTKVALVAMHLAVAVALIAVLRRSSGPDASHV